MKKVKLQLPTGKWDDIASKYSPDDNLSVPQNAFTNGTKNIDTEADGTIRKMKGGIEFASLSSVAKDQHEAIFSDGTRHLLVVENGILKYTGGVASLSTVTSGYSTAGNFEFSTIRDRVYFGNGINPNQVYDKATNYGGVAYSAPQTKVMGCQVPSTTATAALGAVGSNVPAGGHTYKITYLYYDSEESNGSTASNLVTVTGANEQVDLTSVPIGGYGVTARKIYRDDNDGVYVLIGTINDNTTTTFSDTFAGGTTPIPVLNDFAPVFGLVKLFLDRLWFAKISGEPFTLYFSEVGLPDIVESTNYIDCNPEDPITAITVYRGRLIVFNRKSMGQVTGYSRDSFAYSSIEGSVGCVDNRSVQEVVLQGVPTLIWLSDQGFYGFNGSSIFYLSESIEDLVNSNIKQTIIQKNQHVDTTTTDFNAGTASDGIDVLGGQISVRGYVDGTGTVGNNPRRTWNDTSDWDGGTLDNISTIGQANQMTIVADSVQDPTSVGTLDTAIVDGSSIKLPVVTPFTGESRTASGYNQQITAGNFLARGYYQRIIPERSGTITELRVSARPTSAFFGGPPSGAGTYEIGIMAETGGLPDRATKLGTTTAPVSAHPDNGYTTVSVGIGITGGTPYWIYQEVRAVDNLAVYNLPYTAEYDGYLSGESAVVYDETNFRLVTNTAGETVSPAMDYTMVADPVPLSGTWTSEIIDTQSTTANPDDITFTASYPSGTNSTALLEGGDSIDFAGQLVVEESQVINDNSGAAAITLGSRRYYQTKITLSTDDDTTTPAITSDVDFAFDTTAVWESEAIDTTADSTIYNTLAMVSDVPAGTAVLEIRTGDNLGALAGDSYVTFGSHTVRKYAQLRVTFTKPGGAGDRPSVESINMTWTIVSNLISQAIDTNVDPAGWDVFQSDFTENGGTALFEQKSATTSPGLSGATYYTVTNGEFPTASLPTDQFTQWRVTITATDGNIPVINSVTLKWFIGDNDNIRTASIFYQRNYYIALAEFGNDQNNVIVELDMNGKWRVKRGLGVSTLGYFFNDPYFGSSDSDVMGKFLQSFTDLGDNIEIDIRTRAFDYSSDYFDNSEFSKIPESFILEGRGTGATYDVSYSLDNGVTFTAFKDITTGSTTYTTTNDNQLFSRVFRIDTETDGISGARTIMYRIHSDDEFDVKINRIKATAFLTIQEPIITG